MKVWTDAIDDQGHFDPRYTCDIDNSSPELRWSDTPEGTESIAVIAEDLDAQGSPFAHWVVYNIPKTVFHLPTGIPPQDTLPNGIQQGVNGFGKLGYAGPCPPRGSSPHRYVFRVYALRMPVSLPSRVTREQLLASIRDFTISSAEVTGRYQRMVERAG